MNACGYDLSIQRVSVAAAVVVVVFGWVRPSGMKEQTNKYIRVTKQHLPHIQLAVFHMNNCVKLQRRL